MSQMFVSDKNTLYVSLYRWNDCNVETIEYIFLESDVPMYLALTTSLHNEHG